MFWCHLRKNWCFWTVVLEKTLESPLDCKKIQPVHPKGDQPWMFIGRTDVEAETPILWPPDAKSWLIWKDPDVGKDWGQEKGMPEDEMAGWHHWLDGRESVWSPGVGDGQEGLACCDSWGCKESDTTERLNWTEPQGTRLRGIWTQASFSTKVMKPAHPGLPEQPPRRFRCWHQTQWSRSCCCLSLSSRVGRTGESWNWQLSPSAPAEVEVVFFIHPLHNLLLYVNSGAVL